ncbi:MAG: alkanesulfonate monooxygenase [Thermomicrobiales bacterium]|jgi:alkanesulfonate monooxygenase|nr:alkanesulfonate monooxygenase [Thermomicrobiales bacterium]
MPVEFIGMIRTRDASELTGPPQTINDTEIDRDYIRDFARAHEDGGFDRVLIGYYSSGPDGWGIASYAAGFTERLSFLIAHRPGFVAPTLAARKAITLDHLTGGRIALHIITGGSDGEQKMDGDWIGHDVRYQRTDEYLDIVKRVWTSDEPFDHEGEFYKVKGAFSAIKPLQQPRIPLYFGGASGPAVTVGAKHADVYALWGEPIAAVKERIAAVRAAAPPGREIRFSVSLRLILGPTEEKAWEKAHAYLERIVSHRAGERVAEGSARPGAVGSQRLLDFAAQQEIFDKRLWTPIALATGAAGNTTALVGTPEQVAESLLDYYDAGITTILIRGFKPLEDVVEYGRDVLPLVKAEVARRDRLAGIESRDAVAAAD